MLDDPSLLPADSSTNGNGGGMQRLALRPREAARALGIGERLLWDMTSRGEIPCVRIGRRVVYPVSVLHDWLAKQAVGGR